MTQAQNSTLALGVTVIGILSAGAFNVWHDRFVVTVVFLAAVPLLAAMILAIWASQVWGMLDIGRYLLSLEANVAEAVDDPPTGLMTWERQLSTQIAWAHEPNYAMNSLAVLGLFTLLTLASISLGAYRAWDDHEVETLLGALTIGLLFLVVVSGVSWSVLSARSRHRGAAGL